jgi:hypothetical protein
MGRNSRNTDATDSRGSVKSSPVASVVPLHATEELRQRAIIQSPTRTAEQNKDETDFRKSTLCLVGQLLLVVKILSFQQIQAGMLPICSIISSLSFFDKHAKLNINDDEGQFAIGGWFI